MTKKQIKARCEEIAREAGAKLTWIKGGQYGYYIPGTNKIFVSQTGSVRSIATIFCHELGHYKNFLSGKYYKYHHYKGKPFTRRFKTKDALVRYALKAEIYTDKVGRRLCKQYFPDIKYKANYKFNQEFYDMMWVKYFGGYYIILLESFSKKPLTFVTNYAIRKYYETYPSSSY